MYTIDYNSFRSTKSFNRRPRFLVYHYTAQDFKHSVELLTGKAVSAHYLIPDITDKTYTDAGFSCMRIFNLVDENERAWHAGISYWAGRNNLNDTSIGIEIVNCASDNNGVFNFPAYKPEQIAALTALSLNILQRYPDISPVHVLGHADIAAGRKSDPGAVFPWKSLYNAGIGAWYDENQKAGYIAQFTANGLPSQKAILDKLARYGYDIHLASTTSGFVQLIRAFQLHFRPDNYTGQLDIETVAILYALVDKYFPGSF